MAKIIKRGSVNESESEISDDKEEIVAEAEAPVTPEIVPEHPNNYHGMGGCYYVDENGIKRKVQ